MHSNQRLGQVSQHIIQSARFANSVNRAGQLRMLSQRLVKQCLLQLAGVSAPQATPLMQRDPTALWKRALAVLFNLLLIYWRLFLPK